MAVTSLGIGSGLDLESLVFDLVNAEIAPTSLQLNRREANLQTELSAIGTLKASLDALGSALEDFSDPEFFLARTVTSGDTELFTVTGDESASPSSYRVEVSQLAEAQRLRSGAFTDDETAVGTGTLTFTIGEESFDLELTEENNTLAQIRDAINGAEDNPGITASIVTGDDGAFLLLSPDETGVENAISISASDDAVGLDGLTFDPADLPGSGFTEENAAEDAVIVVDGITVTSASNTIADAIDGVTIELLSADPGNETSLDVKIDESTVKARVESFVFNYNALIETLNSLTVFDAESEVAGPLIGDSTVGILENQLRAITGNPIEGLSGAFSTLSSIGITLDPVTGTLLKDQEIEGFDGIQTIDEAIEFDLEGLAEFFASENGIASQLTALVEQYSEDDGLLESRIEGLESSLEEIEEERLELEDRALQLEEQLRAEFLALDLLIAELSSTSAFLSQQLAILPGPAELAQLSS
jgi:flagellar hook-associated protein 2